MGRRTGISWTNRSWNPWRGCKKVSPGCQNCYMFTEQRRYGLDPTQVVRTKTWKDPDKWQKEAEENNRIEMVFTCSWSDWFIKEADLLRPEAWLIVRRCKNLIFQILTKRIEGVLERLPADWGDGYPNVALGVSVENQDYLWRIDKLREIPAKIHFVSAEPLLGELTLPTAKFAGINLDNIQWLIAGGESGPNYRPMDLGWVRNLRDKCVKSGVPFFYKQGSQILPGKNNKLDGVIWEQFPAEWLDG